MLFDNDEAVFITAVGTPRDERGDLLEDSFRRHLRDQIDKAHVGGFLVLGSMGAMPSLKLSTCRACAEAAVSETAGRAKIMVGIGDNSVERTLARIDDIKHLELDAVVATTPYYSFSTQADLIYYYTRIADASPWPLYLYDLPQATKVKIELDTVAKLSEHKNIHGAKCSHDPVHVRRLHDGLFGGGFEVISAMYDLIDMFLWYGMTRNLDGFFCMIAPWLAEIKSAYVKKDFKRISDLQRRMTALRFAFWDVGMAGAFTVAMNMLGFEGQFHASHVAPLDKEQEPTVRKLMEDAGLL